MNCEGGICWLVWDKRLNCALSYLWFVVSVTCFQIVSNVNPRNWNRILVFNSSRSEFWQKRFEYFKEREAGKICEFYSSSSALYFFLQAETTHSLSCQIITRKVHIFPLGKYIAWTNRGKCVWIQKLQAKWIFETVWRGGEMNW